MKIRNRESGVVEYTKIFKCEGCQAIVVIIGENEYNSTEFFANDWEIVEITREEMVMFDLFMADAREMIRSCWEVYQGKLEQMGLFEEGDPHGEDKEEDGGTDGGVN